MDYDVPFTHERLDRSLSQIRLISVRPEADGPIRCSIKTIDLNADRTPDYRALSYTWGAQGNEHHIYINDQRLSVRQNLHDFLVAFRKRLFVYHSGGLYEDEIQWLWVDQICIDQAVVEERNHQVRMMSRIYEQATYVYMWLGSSDMRTEAAMKALKTAFRGYHAGIHKTSVKKNKNSGVKKNTCTSASKMPADWPDAIRHFFCNSYWTRLWIVQEVMLARYIRIICGESLLSWEELRRFCLSNSPSLTIALGVTIPEQTVWLAEHALSAKTYGFNELLRAFEKSQCENPRDKVYGLQGLLAQDQKIPIDYGKTVEEVYQDAAFALCATAWEVSLSGSANICKRVDFCVSLASIYGHIFDSLDRLSDDIRCTQGILLKALSSDHRQLSNQSLDQDTRSSDYRALSASLRMNTWRSYFTAGDKSFPKRDDSSIEFYLERVIEESRLPDHWVDRRLFLTAQDMCNIAQSRTKHIESTHWKLDLLLPKKHRFSNPSWTDQILVGRNRSASYQCDLVRDESWNLGEGDDIELEVLFTTLEWNGILTELQTVFVETASRQCSLILTVKSDHRTVKTWEPNTRYLRFGFDLNASCGFTLCDRATCVKFDRSRFWLPRNASRTPEQVLNDHLKDPTLCRLGELRQRTVYTCSTKAKTSKQSAEQGPDTESEDPKALNDLLQKDESGKIRDRDTVMFQCTVAAGYSQPNKH